MGGGGKGEGEVELHLFVTSAADGVKIVYIILKSSRR